jgi:hypothetical protein
MAARAALAGLWLAILYFWMVPAVQPRGHYFGRYADLDLAIGIPLAVVTLWATMGFLLPRRNRRAFAIASIAIVLPAAALFLALDVFHAFFVLGAWEKNFWLDQGHITRVYNKPHPNLGFVRAGGISWGDSGREHYRTDENGFRNPPGLSQADVVFIGDSYTEAAEFPEEETFVGRVAAATGLAAANLGRGAYGPQQELIVLRRYGLPLSPRFVIWQIFEGNDLVDAQQFERWRQDPESGDISLFRRYFSNSLARQWLKETLELPALSGPPATLRYRDGSREDFSVRYHERQAARPDDPGLIATRRAIEEGHRICGERGVELLVIFIPTMLRVLKQDIEFLREEDRAEYVWREDAVHFESALAGLCGRIGCAYLNLEPALRKAAAHDNRGLFIPSDEHLAARGHLVAAENIAAWLAARGLR